MNSRLRRGIQIAAVLSFALCLLGGLWILADTGLNFDDKTLSTGIGLYFIGKAFFVGPMLLIAAESLRSPND